MTEFMKGFSLNSSNQKGAVGVTVLFRLAHETPMAEFINIIWRLMRRDFCTYYELNDTIEENPTSSLFGAFFKLDDENFWASVLGLSENLVVSPCPARFTYSKRIDALFFFQQFKILLLIVKNYFIIFFIKKNCF